MFLKIILVCCCVVNYSKAAFEGDLCTIEFDTGVCTNLRRCRTAIEGLKRKIRPQLCGFVRDDPIVCCFDTQMVTNPTFILPAPTESTDSEEFQIDQRINATELEEDSGSNQPISPEIATALQPIPTDAVVAPIPIPDPPPTDISTILQPITPSVDFTSSGIDPVNTETSDSQPGTPSMELNPNVKPDSESSTDSNLDPPTTVLDSDVKPTEITQDDRIESTEATIDSIAEPMPTVMPGEIEDENSNCSSSEPTLPAGKNGQKAYAKCLEYQKQLVYPCEESGSEDDRKRINQCRRNATEMIPGKINTSEDQFPHLVRLGYGSSAASAKWQCAGSIISQNYILTSAYCATSKEQGDVAFVRVGALPKGEDGNNSNIYNIKKILKHPLYEAPVWYHDIALLELENDLELSSSVVPACLHVGNPVNYKNVVYTSWSSSNFNVPGTPETLDRSVLQNVPYETCSAKYPPFRLISNGIDNKTQLCYVDTTQFDCLGERGNSILIEHAKIKCMYSITGVTSLRTCAGSPGIFTNLSPYLSWVEAVVWP